MRWVTTESTYWVDISLQNYDWKLKPTRFSSWSKFVRIQAWVYRFINNCYMGKYEKSGKLSKDEIMETENNIISDKQKKAFTEEYKSLRSKKQLSKESRFLALTPFIDEQTKDSNMLNTFHMIQDFL